MKSEKLKGQGTTQRSWRLIIDKPREAAVNMGIDEAFLIQGIPTLRFYQWSEPSVSFGYFQHQETVAGKTRSPIVRRRTGGGMVFHGENITFSLIVPEAKAIFGSVKGSYSLIHEGVAKGLQAFGIEARLAPEQGTEPEGLGLRGSTRSAAARRGAPAWCGSRGHGECFTKPVCDDVVVKDKKIAGGAQWWTGGKLLHQGEIAIPWSEEKVGSLVKSFEECLGVAFPSPYQPQDPELVTAYLLAEKYQSSVWMNKC